MTSVLKLIIKRDLVKGSILSFIFRLIGVGCSYIFTLSISQIYGAETLGRMSLSMIVFQIFTVILSAGIPTAILKFVAADKKLTSGHFQNTFFFKSLLLIFISSTAGSSLLYLSSQWISTHIFNDESLSSFLSTFALVIPAFALLQALSEYFRARKEVALFNSLIYIFPFLIPSIFILLFYFFSAFVQPDIFYIIGIVISLIIAVGIFLQKGFHPSLYNAPKVKARFVLTQSFPMLLSNSLVYLMGWIDTLMLGYLASTIDVGLYSVVVKVSNFSLIFISSVNTTSAPKIASLYAQGQKEKLAHHMRNSTNLIFGVSIIMILLAIAFNQQILSLFGEEFRAGGLALIILLAGQAFNTFSGNVGVFMNMTGGQKMLRNFTFIAVILNIILNYLFIPHFGIVGAAAGSAAANILLNTLCIIFVYKQHRILTTFSLPLNKLNFTKRTED
jgi:O-antigen/teichoic acid export membrane protein